mmetsp:Transcript_34193/g.102291  ORF Transcript_34193/g.102291 Transcript_34193/m.102291 type:complete len:520 (+) Transcript_34193:697-2256(+)
MDPRGDVTASFNDQAPLKGVPSCFHDDVTHFLVAVPSPAVRAQCLLEEQPERFRRDILDTYVRTFGTIASVDEGHDDGVGIHVAGIDSHTITCSGDPAGLAGRAEGCGPERDRGARSGRHERIGRPDHVIVVATARAAGTVSEQFTLRAQSGSLADADGLGLGVSPFVTIREVGFSPYRAIGLFDPARFPHFTAATDLVVRVLFFHLGLRPFAVTRLGATYRVFRLENRADAGTGRRRESDGGALGGRGRGWCERGGGGQYDPIGRPDHMFVVAATRATGAVIKQLLGRAEPGSVVSADGLGLGVSFFVAQIGFSQIGFSPNLAGAILDPAAFVCVTAAADLVLRVLVFRHLFSSACEMRGTTGCVVLLENSGRLTDGGTRRRPQTLAWSGADAGRNTDARGRRGHLTAQGPPATVVLFASVNVSVEVDDPGCTSGQGAAAGDPIPGSRLCFAIEEVTSYGFPGECALVFGCNMVSIGTAARRPLGPRFVLEGRRTQVLDAPLVDRNFSRVTPFQFQNC